MELSILLAQVIGIYALVMGVVVFARKEFVLGAMSAFVTKKSLTYIVASAELIAGLFLALGHNVWQWNWMGLITLIGWIMVVEGVLFLFLPHRVVKKIVRSCVNNTGLYTLWAIIAVIIGVYLISVGF